jgi:hypothetical protein
MFSYRLPNAIKNSHDVKRLRMYAFTDEGTLRVRFINVLTFIFQRIFKATTTVIGPAEN